MSKKRILAIGDAARDTEHKLWLEKREQQRLIDNARWRELFGDIPRFEVYTGYQGMIIFNEQLKEQFNK